MKTESIATSTITTTTAALKEALTLAAKIAGRKRPIPVLNYAMFKDGHIIATDLEMYVRIPFGTATPDNIRGTFNGAFLVPIKQALDAVKSVKDAACVLTWTGTTAPGSKRCAKLCRENSASQSGVYGYWLKENDIPKFHPCETCGGEGYEQKDITRHEVTLAVGTLQFKLLGLPTEDFPTIKTFKDVKATIRPASVWRGLIEKVLPAMSPDASKYTLSGLSLETMPEGLRLIGTDGHRLHMAHHGCNIEAQAAETVLLPGSLCKILLATMPKGKHGSDEVFIGTMAGVHGPEICVRLWSGVEFYHRGLTGQFPNWRAVVDGTNGRSASTTSPAHLDVTIERATMLAAVKAMAPHVDERSQAIRLAVTENNIRLSAGWDEGTQAARAQMDVPATTASYPSDYKVAFNVNYLLDVLTACGSEFVTMVARDAESSHMLAPFQGSDLYIVMPMRL